MLIDKVFGDQEDVAACADIFTQDDDAIVALERFVERLANGLDIVEDFRTGGHCHGCHAPS
jgi:hypothetical protein